MQSDLKGPRLSSREIVGFKGLMSMAEDTRAIPDGYCQFAKDVVFDKNGNARPRDGSATYWNPISQRIYFSEALPSESWSGGAIDYTDYQFGYSSRKIQASGTTDMILTLAEAEDLTLAGQYTTAQTYYNIWVKAAVPSDVTAAYVYITSGSGFTDYTLKANITAAVNALTANTWTLIQVALSSFVAVGSHAINTALVTEMEIAATCTSGDKLGFDEMFFSYNNYGQSFALGGMEFSRIRDGAKFTLAAFGESIYADLNGAQNPYKIHSQQTRNQPTYFDVAEDKVIICDGVDAPLIFTGNENACRPAGFPAPSGSWAPAYTYSNTATGAQQVGDAYFYGVNFVYGENGVVFGESNILISATATSVTGGNNTTTLNNIPTGLPGSAVIKRRIFRCRQAAGNLASQYMVAEIEDNTTTTYVDGSSDAVNVLNEIGPIDNGLPPVSKMACWFQKGMIYVTSNTVQWSRVGVNLDSDMEIVPGENVLAYGQFGPLVGGVEFNGNFYLFGTRGITALYWQGSTLYDRPVQRTAETRAQNIGAYDGRGITVVQNRYIRWMDNYGQIWKMYPNEQIEPDSQGVANLVDNFNNFPLANSQEYADFVGASAWNSGTVGSNLTTSETVGALQYKNTTAARSQFNGGIPSPYPLVPPFRGAVQPVLSPASGIIGSLANPNFAAENFYLQNPNPFFGAGAGQSIYIPITMGSQAAANGAGCAGVTEFALTIATFYNGASTQTYTWKLFRPNYEQPTLLGAQLDSGNCAVVAIPKVNGVNAVSVECTLSSTVYFPAGETLILEIILASWTGPTGYQAPFIVFSTGIDQAADVEGTIVPSSVSSSTNWLSPGTNITAFLNTVANVYISGLNPNSSSGTNPGGQSSITQGGDVLQRWWNFSAGAEPNLRCAQSMTVEAWAFNGAQTYASPGATVYSKTTVTPSDTIEPIFVESYPFFPVPDYRPAAAAPSPPYDYTEIVYAFNFQFPTAPQAPTSNGQSRISITQSDCVPQILDPQMTYSKEASFTSPYNPAQYTDDIWTSAAILLPNSANAFGTFSVSYSQNQENLTFQFRAADTLVDLATAAWVTIPPNVNLANYYTPPAGMNYCQLQIIFQDNPYSQTGVPSAITAMRIAWTSSADLFAPILPPVLYYYKDYTYISWSGRHSHLPDNSLAVDDYADNVMEQYQTGGAANRWSSFTGVHYGCYMVVDGMLVGGPTSGGVLVTLRQSAVTDWTGAPVYGFVGLWPTSLGTPFIKSLGWLYVGMQLNLYEFGFFQSQATQWPTPSDNATPQAGTIYFAVAGDAQAQANQGLAQPPAEPSPSTGADPTAIHAGGGNTSTVGFGGELSLGPVYGVGSPGIPFQPEFGTDTASQERAFQFQAWLYPYEDIDGNAWFPMLTNVGFEWYTENYRGM